MTSYHFFLILLDTRKSRDGQHSMKQNYAKMWIPGLGIMGASVRMNPLQGASPGLSSFILSAQGSEVNSMKGAPSTCPPLSLAPTVHGISTHQKTKDIWKLWIPNYLHRLQNLKKVSHTPIRVPQGLQKVFLHIPCHIFLFVKDNNWWSLSFTLSR